MEKVRQDYRFTKLSLVEAQFIVDVHDLYPPVVMTNVSKEHMYVAGMDFLNVETPHDIAVLLKLKYSGNLVIRPPKVIEDDLNKQWLELIGGAKFVQTKKRPSKYSYDFEATFDYTKFKILDDLKDYEKNIIDDLANGKL